MSFPNDSKAPVILHDWYFAGHHIMYMRFYIQALAELGVPVMALCHDPAVYEDVRERFGKSRSGPLVALRPLRKTKYKSPWPQPLRSLLNYRTMMSDFRNGLRDCEAVFGRPPGLLFFNCIYHWNGRKHARFARISGLPYSGLLLHRLPDAETSKTKQIRELLSDPRVRAYATLDETLVAREKDSPGRAIFFPDLTEETSDASHPIIRELREFARGRPLVLAIGHLQPSKGIASLARAALSAECPDVAFAFVGEISASKFTSEEMSALNAARANTSNCYFKYGRVDDAVSYNAYVQACDILFAAYRNFQHSSNTLTKAAVFDKPIIVSDGHIMASRVREFRMGEVVPQDDTGEIINAIKRISGAPASWREAMNPRWADYRRIHSFEGLKDSLSQLLRAFGIG